MWQRIEAWLEKRLDLFVRRQMLSQPLAAGFAMSSYADAEANGENAVFERALRRASDPKVAQMMRVHQQDEVRHADLLEKRREALGLRRFRVPAHLQMIPILSDEAGGVLDRPMDSDRDVGDTYALLYVVEERAVHNFERLINVFRELGDHETADLFAQIVADEKRHLQYCLAIGKRYMGSEAVFFEEVGRLRTIEARVFARVSRNFVLHLFEHGMFRMNAPWEGLLRAMIGFATALSLPAPRTSLA